MEKLVPLSPIAIKIMESGIFDNGGLNAVYSPQPVPIKDRYQFIYDLAWLLWTYENKKSGYPSEFQKEGFSMGMEHLRIFTMGVQMFKGRRAAQPFKTAQNKLKILERKIKDKPDTPPDVSGAQLKKDMADIFWNHIQATRAKEIMATRSADLLNTFNIPASAEGMREYFKGR